MTADQHVEPEWITAFTEAYERVTGGRYWADYVWDGFRPTPHGPAPWGVLDPAVESDLRAWWHWIDTRPLPDFAGPTLPASETALGYENAFKFVSDLIGLAPPEDGGWNPAWVPLTGDQDSAIFVDTADPRLSVYQWRLEDDNVGPLGYGVPYLSEFYTALLNSDCLGIHVHPRITVFFLPNAPLPPGIDKSHPVVDSAARWANHSWEE